MELIMVVICVWALWFSLRRYCRRRDQHCFLVDYECHKPSDDRKLDTELSGSIVARNLNLGHQEYKFLLRAIVNSGIGEHSYGPRNIIGGRENSHSLEDGILEMDEFFRDTLSQLFVKTKVSPKEIDLLVVNVSLLSCVPSLASRIINMYGMSDDVKSYNLSGMGCSASLVSMNIVSSFFKSQRNSMAVVVTSESIAPNWYSGNDKSMMLTNCLFRSGGCAMLLTNKSAMRKRSKLQLKCLVRTHLGASDEAYTCGMQKEDSQGKLGFYLDKSLPRTAKRAFTQNTAEIAKTCLPYTELIRYLVMKYARKKAALNFKAGIDHFCMHPGGTAVIEEIRKGLSLSHDDVEPSKMSLHRFGNTSASSLWYVLGYMEATKRLRRGDRLWMIGFGSGFKCNSCVWEVIRDLEDANVWEEVINGEKKAEEISPFIQKFSWINQDTFDPPSGSHFQFHLPK